MSEFRNLPSNHAPKQDDELLLVSPTQAQRSSIKSLFWDRIAILKLLWPANSNYGIGTADQWAKIPYNTLEFDSLEGWIQLNADGSFTLNEGLYVLSPSQAFYECDLFRLALYQGDTMISLVSGYVLDSANSNRLANFKKKINLGGQSTFSVQFSASLARDSALHSSQVALAGFQVEVGYCEIIKLG